MPNDKPNLYGLLGKNISYSLSPDMHNAAFQHFNISAKYEIFDKKEDELEDFLRDEVISGNISGMNVTVPYKIKFRELLDNCALIETTSDDFVKIIGAINTVKVDGQKASIKNTDVFGFYRCLEEDAKFDFKNKRDFFIVGAGGAGSAISLFLALMLQGAPRRISVFDVDENRLGLLKEKFDKHTEALGVNVFNPVLSSDEIPKYAGNCDLVVNATPLGTKDSDPLPIPDGVLNKGTVVYDLVYARETELVKQAKEKGLIALNGLGMLVNQAAIAFEFWTGKDWKEVKEVMKKALPEKLKKVYGWNI